MVFGLTVASKTPRLPGHVSQLRECSYSIIDAADNILYAVTSSMNDSCNFLASNGFFALYSLVFLYFVKLDRRMGIISKLYGSQDVCIL